MGWSVPNQRITIIMPKSAIVPDMTRQHRRKYIFAPANTAVKVSKLTKAT